MTFSRQLQLALTLAALASFAILTLPFLLLTDRRAKYEAESRLAEEQGRVERFYGHFQSDVRGLVQEISGQYPQTTFNPQAYGLDFFEHLNSAFTVTLSAARPALVGEELPIHSLVRLADTSVLLETIEYDRTGRHPAVAILMPHKGGYVYAGKYLDIGFFELAKVVTAGTMFIETRAQQNSEPPIGSVNLSTSFEPAYNLWWQPATVSQSYQVTEIVAILFLALIVSAGLVIMTNLYFSRRLQREINNLVAATEEIASGDLSTPVMAYSEGEFATLADALSEMKRRIKEAQAKLIATEKVAAWQSIGRAMAHEIKNPLTPIAISAQDLRRSWEEKLPEFERILMQSTAMIRDEVKRLSLILDEFSAFARLRTPVPAETNLEEFISEVRVLLIQLDQSRVRVVTTDLQSRSWRFDGEQLKQVLLNLVKNGLESSPKANVELTFAERDDKLFLNVTDTGPGFTDLAEANRFEPRLSLKSGGSGLGLVICNRIVVDHGGRMELTNLTGGGAQVTIELPRN